MIKPIKIKKNEVNEILAKFNADIDYYGREKGKRELKTKVIRKVVSIDRAKYLDEDKKKKIFGRNLFIAIHSLHFSINDIGYFANVSENQISKIIRGESDLKLSMINRLCYALQIQPPLLFIDEKLINSYKSRISIEDKMENCTHGSRTLKECRGTVNRKDMHRLAEKCTEKIKIEKDIIKWKMQYSSCVGAAIGAYHGGVEGFFIGWYLGNIFNAKIKYEASEDIEVSRY